MVSSWFVADSTRPHPEGRMIIKFANNVRASIQKKALDITRGNVLAPTGLKVEPFISLIDQLSTAFMQTLVNCFEKLFSRL